MVLQYTSNLGYTKLFFISIIQTSITSKNYHILFGDDVNLPTIGIRKFTPKNFTLQNLNKYILFPAEINRHLIYSESGKFLQCNKEYASRIPKNTTTNLPPEATGAITKLVDKIIETGQIPFMSFGTLLGL